MWTRPSRIGRLLWSCPRNHHQPAPQPPAASSRTTATALAACRRIMCILTMPTKTRYGDSPWSFAFPDSRRPNYPRLRGSLQRDVVIIGAGLTGIATAYACAMAGLNTTVLEANRLGSGSAGRSAGLLLPEPGPSFRVLQQAHGLRAARTVFETWRRASLDAAALLRRLSIQCALEPLESVTISREEKTLRREFDTREAGGLDGRWLPAKSLRSSLQLDAAAGI